MNLPERHERITALFLEAGELPLDRQGAFLARECADDPKLQGEVEAMLRADQQAPDFLKPVTAGDLRATFDDGQKAKLPERIGKYEIQSLLGEGGAAVVYLAKQENPVRRVALKVIKPGNYSANTAKRLELEARILARMQHPGIAQVFEAGIMEEAVGEHGQLAARRQPFFAMEYVQGKPITQFADDGRLGTRDRLQLMLKVCAAVEHAHQRGVIHRDLKPSNILVAEEGTKVRATKAEVRTSHEGTKEAGHKPQLARIQEAKMPTPPSVPPCLRASVPQPKVLDFGIARVTDADIQATTQHTGTGLLIGTIPYMSPEQTSGDADALDTRSDIYALGVVCYELLAGRLPYDIRDKALYEAVRVIREVDPTPLSTVNRVFRGDLDCILAKALEKDPTRRYATVSALAADIQRFLSDEPIRARPPSMIYQLRKFARRNRGVVTGTMLAFFALALGGGLAVWQAVTASRERDRAVSAEQGSSVLAGTVLNMIGKADPWEVQGNREVLMRLLDGAAEEITRAPLDALVQARFFHTLGVAYSSMGGSFPTLDATRKAEAHLRHALEIRVTQNERDSLETVATKFELGQVLTDLVRADDALGEQGQNLRRQRAAEAETLLRSSLEIRRRLLGADRRESLDAQQALGSLLRAIDRINEAAELTTDVYERRRRAFGDDDSDTMVSLAFVAELTFYQGRFNEAESLFQGLYQRRLRVLGDRHWQTASAATSLAIVLQRQGKLKEAEPVFRQAIEIREGNVGKDDLDVLMQRNNFALLVLERMDKWDEAEITLRDVLERRLRLLGPTHGNTLRSMNNLANLLRDRGRPEEAEPLYRQLIESAKIGLRPGHDDLPLFERNFGKCLLDLQRLDQAELFLLSSYETYKASKGANDAQTEKTANWLVELYEAWGKPAEAAKYRTAPKELQPPSDPRP